MKMGKWGRKKWGHVPIPNEKEKKMNEKKSFGLFFLYSFALLMVFSFSMIFPHTALSQQKQLAGTVISVGKFARVRMNIGAKQKVEFGMKFNLVRQGEVLGQMVVKELYETEAILYAVEKNPTWFPQKGDILVHEEEKLPSQKIHEQTTLPSEPVLKESGTVSEEGKSLQKVNTPRPAIGVVEFAFSGDSLSYLTGSGPTSRESFMSRLEGALLRTERFTIVDRISLDKVAAEQALGLSGMIDPEKAAKVGQMRGAQGIVYGSVLNMSVHTENVKNIFTGNMEEQDVANVSLDARLMDTATAEVLTSVSASGQATGSVGAGDSLLAQAFDEACWDAAKKMAASFPFKLTVLQGGSDQIYLEGGKDIGVVLNQEYDVVRQVGEIKNVQGKILGLKKQKVGKIRVTQVEENYSLAQVFQGKNIQVGDKVESTPKISGSELFFNGSIVLGGMKAQQYKTELNATFGLRGDYFLTKGRKVFAKRVASLEVAYTGRKEDFMDAVKGKGVKDYTILPVRLSLGLAIGGINQNLYLGPGISYIFLKQREIYDDPSYNNPITKKSDYALGYHLQGSLYFGKVALNAIYTKAKSQRWNIDLSGWTFLMGYRFY